MHIILSRYYHYRDNIVMHYRDIGFTIIAQPYSVLPDKMKYNKTICWLSQLHT